MSTYTAGKDLHWVKADTVEEVIAAYVKMAAGGGVGTGSIYRTDDPMGKRFTINAHGVVFDSDGEEVEWVDA